MKPALPAHPSRSSRAAPLLFLGLMAALPLIGRELRSRRPVTDRCVLDGVEIEAIYRVRILPEPGRQLDFCCLVCAGAWYDRSMRPEVKIEAADESSGRLVLLETAHLVRSGVVTRASTGNRIHVFAREEDALRHAAAYRGRVLMGTERPFRPRAARGEGFPGDSRSP